MTEKREYDLFAVTAPGLEKITAGELTRLGIRGTPEAGGVGWRGDFASLCAANLHLRSASRVLARVDEFRARSFIELERHVRRIDWNRFATDGAPVRLRVTSRKSKLYHERAIEERFAREIEQAVGVAVDREVKNNEEDEGSGDGQLFVIRFLRDRCVVSADTSGALLHRRGYRQAVAKAPLRETLAAAMLLAIEWEGLQAIVDPFCGSGTIPIEAALIARQIPPGMANPTLKARSFAFLSWPETDERAWNRVQDAARREIRDEVSIPIVGSDRDAGAIQAARNNAQRAGVAEDIQFENSPLSAATKPADAGWIITNPPYGVRVGNTRALRDLYASLGQLLRTWHPEWRLALLSADEPLERQIRLELHELLTTRNGGIAVRLMAG